MRTTARFAPHITALVLVVFAVGLAGPVLSAPVPSQPVGLQGESREQLLARAEKAVNVEAVQGKLKAFGMTEKQIASRMSNLSDQELRVLATGAETLHAAAAGEPQLSTTTWMLIIIILLLLAG